MAQYCKALDEQVNMEGTDRTWEGAGFADMTDCQHQIGKTVARDEFVSLVVTLLLQLHFCFVLWTHFKNSDLVKSKGGCRPDGATADVQLGGVFG